MATVKKVRASTSFSCDVGGVEYLVHAGDVLPVTDPVVKKHREFFEAEQATAAPGQVR
jgi:hypothetical protein